MIYFTKDAFISTFALSVLIWMVSPYKKANCIVFLAEANEVFTRKMEEFTERANSNQKMRQMVKALHSVSETVKLTIEFISESPKRNDW